MAKKETLLSVAKEIRDVLVTNSTLNKIVKGVKDMKSRFTKNDNGAVIDATGLMWGPTFPKQMGWAEAEKACKELKLGDHQDWRLPTVNELFSLVDRKKHNPAIDTSFFPDTKSSWYWTSETYADSSGFAWFVSFYDGYVTSDGKSSEYYVRPVRSSQ